MPVRRNRPQHVSRVDAAQLVSARQLVNAELHSRTAATLALHVSSPFQPRQARRPVKRNLDLFVERISNRERRARGIALSESGGAANHHRHYSNNSDYQRLHFITPF